MEPSQADLYAHPVFLKVYFYLAIVGIPSTIAAAWLLFRNFQKDHTGYNKVAPVRFKPFTFAVFMLAIVVIIKYGGILAPFFILALVYQLMLMHDLNYRDLWNCYPRDLGKYYAGAFGVYTAILLPIGFWLAVSSWFYHLMNWEVPVQTAIQYLLNEKNPAKVAQIVFFAVVVAPIWEEAFFRGVLYPYLKKYFSMVGAVVATSLIFAVIHGHGPGFMALFFLGVVLNLMYERTGSLGYNIALHSIFNAGTSFILLMIKYANG
jgi:membrane protease YdiL (CAAX protease family)